MWRTLYDFVKRHRLTVILLSGLGVFFASGMTTFFWANSAPDEAGTMVQRRAEATPNQTSSGEDATSENRSDTLELTPSNWEAFLEYEGPRHRMLGIKKSYSAVNFRRGYTVGSERIATPEGGTLLEPIDQFNEWYRARLPGGRIGWIHESLVRQIDVPEPVAESVREEYPPLKESTRDLIPRSYWDHNRVVITEDAVNVRQGPGTQFRRIGRSYKHEQLRLLAKQGNWYRIQTVNENYGWIHQSLAEPRLLDEVEGPESIRLPSAQLRPGPEYQLREQQTNTDSVEATVIEQNENWYQVRVDNGNIGWIPKENVSVTN
jgi:uncharacterized protein YgiM (DUF1202 family)